MSKVINGNPPAFSYPTVDGVCLSPEEIGNYAYAALDLARGIHGVCELALANRNGGKVDCDDESLFRVIHAAMEKTIEIGNHLFYDPIPAQEGEGE